MKLFYRKIGTGRPIIILHGLFGMSDNWVSISKILSEKNEIYIPDMRNHGQSPHSEEFSYEIMTSDIKDFIDLHNIKSPIIIGHSMGGKVAMSFALHYKEFVEKLIVVDISPAAYSEYYEHNDLIGAMKSINLITAKTYKDIDQALSFYPISQRIRQFLLKNIYKKPDGTFDWKFNIDSIENNIKNLLKSVDNNETFEKPALFIRGGKSAYVKPEDEIIIKRIFKKSEIKTIISATHWVHSDAPNEFIRVVSEFINN